jgi:hypothetical protein
MFRHAIACLNIHHIRKPGWVGDYLVAGHITGKNDGNVGDDTVLLYPVVTLTIQRFVLLNRVARQEAAGTLSAGPPRVPLGG